MAGPKRASSLSSTAASAPISHATAQHPVRKSKTSGAGVESDDRRLTIRLPDEEAAGLKKARIFLVGQGRKSIDGRILLTALRLAKLDEDFLKEYDAFDERDGRSRASLAK